ncbi:hypothetical protein GGX14DRAFT_562415 [Mycena pura]|uniref:Uncharacterized protein n=1 Tax=Mycena pura TaxID=153505 RepID=A0AAD6YDX3_9AGAR|nr:hypothetical protein GGX14DRAFT_562415 [Mycena pura]
MPPPQRFFPLSHHVPAPATDERADASNVDQFLMQNDASWTNYSAWFRNKVMHTHLLPGLVQPLSRISVDNWHLLPPNTNYGEGQHHWNNLQTGVSMTVIESMEK